LRPVVIELSGLRPSFAVGQPLTLNVEAVEKPLFHPEMVVKMAQDFPRHLHFIG
jgi:hypothetical protein